MRLVSPVYRKMPEMGASHSAVQEYAGRNREESVAEPTAVAPMAMAAVQPIGKLRQDITRAIGRWQEKAPAVHIAFRTRLVRERQAPDRTAAAGDEEITGPATAEEMPFPTSSMGNTGLAETSNLQGNALAVPPGDFRFPITRGIELTERLETATSSAHGWPALKLLPRLTAVVSQGARASEPARRIANAISALRSLPALGPGEPLVEPVKPVMEKLTGRDLSQVRVYSSPAAAALGAEAFTSGQRIVFAPGRMDLRSSRGLALLGHELAHLGQPLALKSNDGGSLVDAAERVALEQETTIQRLFEMGGITPPRMDLLRVVSEARAAEHSANESGTAVHGELDSASLAPTDFIPESVPASQPTPGTVQAPSRQTASAPVAATSPNATPPLTQPDIDALARKVYDLLKDRLRSERERHDLYSR